MVYTLRFFPSKFCLFHNSNVFCSCIIHILYTGCAKIKKNNSGAKRLTSNDARRPVTYTKIIIYAMKHNSLCETVGFILLPVEWCLEIKKKIKLHSTACKISVQVDNISYCPASWKPWVVPQLVSSTLSLKSISMGRSIMDSNLVRKKNKNKFSPWFIIFCTSYEFQTWKSTSSALCRSTVWRMCET